MGLFDCFRRKKEPKLTKYGNPNQDYKITEKEWAEKAISLAIPIEHPPHYLEEEKFIMGIIGAKGLRFSEPDKDDTAAPYLVIREAMRRHVKGYSNRKNNYIKLAVRAFERLQEAIVDDKLKLTQDYTPREVIAGYGEDQLKEGDLDHRGFYYVSYFRSFVPYEEFDLLCRIGKLKRHWNNQTRLDGLKRPDGDVAAYRKECMENGYVDNLLKELNLPEYYKQKLTLKYTPRKK